MGSMVKPLWAPEEGQDYIFRSGEFVIKADNSFEEILYHMMGEMSGSPEDRFDELRAILETISMSEFEAYLKRYDL
jgi:hemerythrin superfamily protein